VILGGLRARTPTPDAREIVVDSAGPCTNESGEEFNADGLVLALLELDRVRTESILREAAAGSSVVDVVDGLVVPVLERFGARWEAGDVSLAEVYMAARLVEAAVDTVLPPPESPTRGAVECGSVVAICVLEDSHGLGKRIVSSCLRATGIDVVDLGHRVSVEQAVEEVKARGIDILLVSVLMLRAALAVKQLTARLAEEGLGDVRVIVGGAPFRYDPELWREVGAHGCGRSASEAIEIVRSTMAAQ
jgi:methylmalonyl-CoA mutase cobalamin-binding domain/chain